MSPHRSGQPYFATGAAAFAKWNINISKVILSEGLTEGGGGL
jgi:hypothetical protein